MSRAVEGLLYVWFYVFFLHINYICVIGSNCVQILTGLNVTLETVWNELGVVQFQVLSSQMSRRGRKTTKDAFTSAGLRQSSQFRTDRVSTVWLPNSAARYGQQHCHSLTSHCCRLHTNMSERDDTSSPRYMYVVSYVAELCQLLYAKAAYRRCVTCACTYHVHLCTVC